MAQRFVLRGERWEIRFRKGKTKSFEVFIEKENW